MRILFNDFKKQYADRGAAIDAAAHRVFASGYYILGPEVKAFETAFASYLGATYAIGVANGLEALQIALLALGVGEGDEVITTSFSAVATTLAIRAVGASPVFVDIDTAGSLDASLVESAITKKTKALLPVHLYGLPADMKALVRLSETYRIPIVEDCAQAHGAEYAGKKVGTFGTFGCFSFYPTKNLGAIGDGGALITNDAALAEKCRMLRNYGQKDRYHHEFCGINSRLDELQAALLTTGLTHLDNDNARRREIAKRYRTALSGIKGLTPPQERLGAASVYHLFVIRTKRRDALQAFLKEKGIDTLIHYPIPIHKQNCLPTFNSLSLPQTEMAAEEVLSLPIHPYLTNEEVAYVCEAIRSFYGS